MATDLDNSPYASNVADPPEFAAKLERYPRRQVVQLVRELSQVNGWRTTGLLVMHWSIILAAGATAIWSGHWAVYLVAILIIATRQQALGVMLHDATHYLLYKNRVVNDMVCDALIAFPLGLSTDLYRATHFRHHLYTNTADDPDLQYQKDDPDWFNWPKSNWKTRWVILKSFLGLNLHKAYKPLKMWSPWMNIGLPLEGKPKYPLRSRILLVVSTVLIYALVIGSGLIVPVLILWALPGLTLLNLVNRMRATAEHIGAPGNHELNATRTVIPSLWERLVIAPMGVNFHLEHHLFPSVPGPNLAKLHRALMEDESFSSKAHITQSYVGVVRELMQTKNPKE